jgi:hypothetical protein
VLGATTGRLLGRPRPAGRRPRPGGAGAAATCGRTPPTRPWRGCWPATASTAPRRPPRPDRPPTSAVDSPRSVFATVDRNDRSPAPPKR